MSSPQLQAQSERLTALLEAQQFSAAEQLAVEVGEWRFSYAVAMALQQRRLFDDAERICTLWLQSPHWLAFAQLLVLVAAKQDQWGRCIELWRSEVSPRLPKNSSALLDATVSTVLVALVRSGRTAEGEAELGPWLLARMTLTEDANLRLNATCFFAQRGDVASSLRVMHLALGAGTPLETFRREADLAPIRSHPAVAAFLERGARAFRDGACIELPEGLMRLTLRGDTVSEIRAGAAPVEKRHPNQETSALFDYFSRKVAALGREVDDPGERALVEACETFLATLVGQPGFAGVWNVLRLEWDYESHGWAYWAYPQVLDGSADALEEYPWSDHERSPGFDAPFFIAWDSLAEPTLRSGRPASAVSFTRVARALAKSPNFQRLQPRFPFFFVLQEHDAGVEFVAEVARGE